MRTGDLSAGNLQNSFLTGFQILPSVPPCSVVPDVPLFRDHIDRFNKLFALYIKMKGTNMYSNISCEKMVVDAAKVPSSSKDLFVVESTSIKRFDSTLCTRSACFHTYTSCSHGGQRSSVNFFLLDTPQTALHSDTAGCLPTYGYDPGMLLLL